MELTYAGYTFIETGVLGRTTGIKGFIYCHFNEEFQSLEESVEFLFLMDGGNPFPLKIREKKFKNGFLVRFDKKYPLETVKKWTNQVFYLNKADLDESILKPHDPIGRKPLIGFKFYDNTSSLSGIIKDISEYPHQLMITATIGKKEYLFPIHEDLIDSVDKDKKVINFHLPEGIFNINT